MNEPMERSWVTPVWQKVSFTCRKLRPDEMVEPHACISIVWAWGFLFYKKKELNQ